MDKMKQKLQRLEGFLAQDPQNLSLMLDIAECHALLGDKSSAQTMIDKARPLNAQAAAVAQGLLHLNFGELNEATEVFERALLQDKSPAVRYNLAFCFYAKENFEKAFEVLLPVIEKSAENFPPALILMARIEHHRGNIDHGISLLQKHLQLAGHHAESLGLLSLLYFDNNAYEQAKVACQKALQLDSNNIDALSVDAYLKIAQQTIDSQQIRQVIKRSPRDGRLYFSLGNSLLKENQVEAAIEAFKTAAALLPGFSENSLALGWSYLLLDDLAQAKQAFQHALDQEPGFAEAHGGLAIVDILSDELASGMAAIEKALAFDEQCHLATLAQALYYRQSNKEKAQFFYQKAIQGMAKDSGFLLENTPWIEQFNPQSIH